MTSTDRGLVRLLVQAGRTRRSTTLVDRSASDAEVVVDDGCVVEVRYPGVLEPPILPRDSLRTGPSGSRAWVVGSDVPVDVALDRHERALDALRELVERGPGLRWRSRRSRGRVGGGSVRLPVEWALAEISRRGALLNDHRQGPGQDTAVVRRARVQPGTVRVRPDQWELLRATAVPVTPRDLARDLRESVFRCTRRVSELVDLGLLQVAEERRSTGAWSATGVTVIGSASDA